MTGETRQYEIAGRVVLSVVIRCQFFNGNPSIPPLYILRRRVPSQVALYRDAAPAR